MNTDLFFFFNNLAGKSNFFDGLVVFIANDLQWVIILFALIYFLTFDKRIKRFFIFAILVLFAGMIAHILKSVIFNFPRPFAVLEGVIQLLDKPAFESFPSGHATIFAAISTVMYMYHKQIGWVFIVLTVMIGISRIIAGVHFPIDILAGFFLGFATVFFSYKVLRKAFFRLRDYIE